MARILKIIGTALGVLILLAVIAAISLVIFVSPNRFKPLITEQVKKSTGRVLTIDGNLAWNFFPSLGVKVGHMELDNPAGFQQKIFAEIDHATVSVKLFPLMAGHVESSGITLSGMKLNLIKNASGVTNWQDLQQKSAGAQKKTLSPDEKIKSSSFNLAVSALDISDSSVSWINEQAKQNFDVQKFELHATDINLATAFPITSSFQFSAKNPNVAGKVDISSEITMNAADQIYILKNADVKATINNLHSEVKGDIVANLDKQTLRLENFSTHIGNINAVGKLDVTQLLSQPQAAGSLQLSPFDLKEFLKEAGQDTSNLKAIDDVSGNVDFNLNAPKTLTARGKLKIATLQTTKIKVTDINVDMNLANNVMQFAPITAKLYQGDLYAQGKVDLSSGVMPQVALQAKLSKIQAKPLLEDLGGANQKLKFSGTGDVDFQIISAGNDANSMVRNLNGSGKLNFADGVVEGVDLGHMVDNAAATVKGQQSSGTDSNQTSFGSLTATFNIQNGVVGNNDLHIDSPRFDTTGKGNIDLVNKRIDYSLQTLVKNRNANGQDNLMNFYGLPLPILITGDLEKPSVRLDTKVLVQALAQKQLQKATSKIQDQIQDQIKGKIPDNAGKLLKNILGK